MTEFKIRGLKCPVCKGNIVVGQQAVAVTLIEDGIETVIQPVHSANKRPSCVKLLMMEKSDG